MQERGNFQGAFAYYHANRARQAGCWVPGTQKQAPNNQGSQGTEQGPPGVRRWVWNPPHAIPTGKAGQTGTGRAFRKKKKEDCIEKLTPGVHHVGAVVLTAAREEALGRTDTSTGSTRAHKCASHFHRRATTKNFHFNISPKFPCTAFHI